MDLGSRALLSGFGQSPKHLAQLFKCIRHFHLSLSFIVYGILIRRVLCIKIGELRVMSLRKIRQQQQRMLELIVVIILIGLFINILATSLYELIPQAMSWFTFSCITVFILAVYLVLVSRLFIFNMKETIPFVFAVNIKKVGIPLYELLEIPLAWASSFFREIIEERPEFKERIETAEFKRKFFLDLTAFLVVVWLSHRYTYCWLWERPLEYSFRRFETGINKSSTQVKSSELQEQIKDNIFSRLEQPRRNITLPPNTTISIKAKKDKWDIEMKNKYCRITIRTRPLAWSCDWNLKDVPVHFSSEEMKEEFEVFDFIIDFEARFSIKWSLCPNIKDYYDWAEGMFERLRDNFDWRVQIQKIRNILETRDSKYYRL